MAALAPAAEPTTAPTCNSFRVLGNGYRFAGSPVSHLRAPVHLRIRRRRPLHGDVRPRLWPNGHAHRSRPDEHIGLWARCIYRLEDDQLKWCPEARLRPATHCFENDDDPDAPFVCVPTQHAQSPARYAPSHSFDRRRPTPHASSFQKGNAMSVAVAERPSRTTEEQPVEATYQYPGIPPPATARKPSSTSKRGSARPPGLTPLPVRRRWAADSTPPS